MPTKSTCLILSALVVLGLCANARAELIINFMETHDGGVRMTANGSTTSSHYLMEAFTFNIVGSEFYTAGASGKSNTAGGSLSIGDTTVDLNSAVIESYQQSDMLHIIPQGDIIGPDNLIANNIFATWSGSALPFSSLTPGTYATDVGGASVVVAAPWPSELVFTLTEAPDGGVELHADGGLRENVVVYDNTFEFEFDVDNLFGPHASGFASASEGGSFTVGSTTASVTAASLNTYGSGDGITLSTGTTFTTGRPLIDDLTATWPVGTLAFADLTPGTYDGMLENVSLIVVPEPTTMSLLALGGLALLIRRKRNK